MRRLRAILAFCYDFVIGDDWTVAAAVTVALAITYAVSRTSVPAWWIVPASTAVILALSLRRATQRE